MPAKFFGTSDRWRTWLERHHATAPELWVGFHKKESGRASITWPESVDQALCFGWIDGVRKRLDESSYLIRFTPRRPGSTWSSVNIGRVGELTRLGLMAAAGLAAFEGRSEAKSGINAYEQRDQASLSEAMEKEFRRNRKAWAYFQKQARSYRHTAIWWVVSAKREDTRARRLATLIEDSAARRPLRQLDRTGTTR